MFRNLIHSTAVVLATAPAAFAGPPEDMVRLDILPGWQTESGTHMAGVRLTLAPGWKTYWRAPGDAGIPPTFSWAGSENIAGARFHWPVPEIFWQNGMQTIGYSHQVVIPVELTPAQAGQPSQMKGQVEIGVCEEICVPVTLDFDMSLPVLTTPDAQIAAALTDRPLTRGEAMVGKVTCRAAPSSEGLWLTTEIEMPGTQRPEVVVIETGDAAIWVSESDVRRDGDRLMARAELIHESGHSFALDRSDVRITVIDSGRTVDIQGCTGD